MKHRIRIATVFALASQCLCSGAGAKIVTFQIPMSYVTGINDKGQVTGFYDDHTGGGQHGFLWQPGGAIATFDVPNAISFQSRGVSATGVVTGAYILGDGNLGGFVRAADGTITTYDVGAFAAPAGMNAKGWVVGASNGTTFLRDPLGEITHVSLPLPQPVTSVVNNSRTVAGVATFPTHDNLQQGFICARNGTPMLFGHRHRAVVVTGINGAGDVVGWYSDGPKWAGFVRTSDGTITTLHASPSAINNSGTITGTFADSAGIPHGFIRTADGTFTPFDPEGSVYTQIRAINNKGAIAGSYYTKDGQFFDFAGKP